MAISVGILGATSYTGVELVKILVKQKHVQLKFLSSKSYAGQEFCNIFGELKGICDLVLISLKEAQLQNVDCVFSCLPHAISADLCMPFIEKGIKIIDLSADFRINDADIYESWYNHIHPAPKLLKQAIYGLCEHNRNNIKTAQILANPGCYPTSILMPILPIIKSEGVEIKSIIVDSKSGVSGAGKALKLISHYTEANENFSAYSIGRKHRHIAEIDQELSLVANREIAITFSPHLIPINRGILSTIYLDVNKSAAECNLICEEYYKDEPFVRIRNENDLPKVSYVAKTNYCDIAFTGGKDNHPVIAVSVIDNLLKGASGQAVQNMNIMFGINETEGLI